jgi:beta-lactamase class A
MDQTRRTLITALGAALGACHSKVNQATPNGGIDLERLTRGFPAIAARAQPGIFNLGVLSMRDDLVWCADNDRRFPLQSVFMAPLAAAALAEVDAGRLTLSERIHVTELDLSPPPSAINQAWPTPPSNHAMDIPAIDLIALAVQKGDSTAADVIMNRIGGPGAVTAWLRGKNISDMRIDRYERELASDIAGMESFRPAWKDEAAFLAARDTVAAPAREAAMNAFLADPRDTTTAPAALNFLDKLAGDELISPASTSLLLRLMTATATGLDRLKAGLPHGASLAHKTGASSTDLGFTAAVGDIGIVTLAGGHRVAVAAFLAGSTATQAQRDAVFADSARLVAAAFH